MKREYAVGRGSESARERGSECEIDYERKTERGKDRKRREPIYR
jgi:hypothetical protein